MRSQRNDLTVSVIFLLSLGSSNTNHFILCSAIFCHKSFSFYQDYPEPYSYTEVFLPNICPCWSNCWKYRHSRLRGSMLNISLIYHLSMAQTLGETCWEPCVWICSSIPRVFILRSCYWSLVFLTGVTEMKGKILLPQHNDILSLWG